MTQSTPLPNDRFDPIGVGPLEARLAMLANGYEPLPLIGPNTGMRAATAPGLDIDILDEQAAQIVEATDAAVFGR
jgi:hypothetical protein